jgi:translation initiation factor IF-2
MQEGDKIELPIIIKADTQGTAEAISESLTKLSTDQITNHIVMKSSGGISESDIRLAETTGSVIIGFQVRAGRGLQEVADQAGVTIKYFSVIYEIVDAIKSIMIGKLPTIKKEVVQGHAEVRNLISISRIGNIAGSAVLDGKITRHSNLRLIRDDVVVYDGRLGSLKRFKDDVKEVATGFECGIMFESYNDIKVGDVIEAYIVEEEAAKLEA